MDAEKDPESTISNSNFTTAPESTISTSSFESSSSSNGSLEQTTTSKTVCIDTDGDGWGWTGTESCKIESPSNIESSNTTPSPTTITKTTTSSESEPLAKSVSTIQDNNSSWSFNNERCDNWALIPYEQNMIQNNVWNDNGMYNKNYSLCIELTGTVENPVPVWRYDFLTEADGAKYEVKAYPQVYYGHKRQSTPSGTAEELGLPAFLADLDNFEVTYQYSENGIGERNVALESFFHTSCDIRPDNQEFELMIWVGKPSIRTGGTDKIGEAMIDGAMWDVWLNKNLSWDYVAFVRQEPSNSGKINWNTFIDWVVEEGPAMGVATLNPNSCMNTIELGTELFWGKGEFILEKFKVERW